jgi:hypothetical protein
MIDINFNSTPDGEHHSCDAIREGDWIIFRCAKCPDYERRMNWRTGEMKTNGAREDVHHSGNYFPHEYADAFANVN